MKGLARIPMHTTAVFFSYLELRDHISLSYADHHCHAVSCMAAASPVHMSVTSAGAHHIEADAAPRAFLRKRPGKLVWAGATRDARWRAAFASSLHTLVVTHGDMSWLDHPATSLLSRLHTFEQVCAYPDFWFGAPAATDQKSENGDGDDGRTADDYWNTVLRLPSLTRLMIQDMSADAFGRLGACAGLRHLVLNSSFAGNEMRRPPSILQSLGAVRGAVATLERLETLDLHGDYDWYQQYPLRLAPLEFDEWLTKLPSLTELRGTLLCVPFVGPLEIGRAAATRLRRCGSVSPGGGVSYALSAFPGLTELCVSGDDAGRRPAGYCARYAVPRGCLAHACRRFPAVRRLELRSFRNKTPETVAACVADIHVPLYEGTITTTTDASGSGPDAQAAVARFPNLECLKLQWLAVSSRQLWTLLPGGAAIETLEMLGCELSRDAIGPIGYEHVKTLCVGGCTMDGNMLFVSDFVPHLPKLETLVYDWGGPDAYTSHYLEDLRRLLETVAPRTPEPPPVAGGGDNDSAPSTVRAHPGRLRRIRANYRDRHPDRHKPARVMLSAAARVADIVFEWRCSNSHIEPGDP